MKHLQVMLHSHHTGEVLSKADGWVLWGLYHCICMPPEHKSPSHLQAWTTTVHPAHVKWYEWRCLTNSVVRKRFPTRIQFVWTCKIRVGFTNSVISSACTGSKMKKSPIVYLTEFRTIHLLFQSFSSSDWFSHSTAVSKCSSRVCKFTRSSWRDSLLTATRVRSSLYMILYSYWRLMQLYTCRV